MNIADYEITLAGELPPEFRVAFAPHRITTVDGTSVIRAEQVDHAALMGLLAKAGDLALDLICVERLGARRAGAAH